MGAVPASPASRKTRATVDQPHAANVPRDTRVSIVAVPWRRFTRAARWNPAPLTNTTGVMSTNAAHGQWANCRAGIMETATAGTVSTTASTSRRASVRCQARSTSAWSSGSGLE